MPTANERRALWFLAAVALSGSVVRLARSRSPDSTPDPALGRQLARVDSVRAAGAKPRAQTREPRTKLKPDTTPVDLNTATAAQIEALPGIGPALASRIVSTRDSLRGFPDVVAFCGVRGVGSALVHRLRSRVTLSGSKVPEMASCPASPRGQKTRAARRQQ